MDKKIQTHEEIRNRPGFVRMLDAFEQINQQRINKQREFISNEGKDKEKQLGRELTAEELQAYSRELTNEELVEIVKAVMKQGIEPNPFLENVSPDKVDDEIINIAKFVKTNSKGIGYIRLAEKPKVGLGKDELGKDDLGKDEKGNEPPKDDKKSIEEQAKKAATDDKAFEKMQNKVENAKDDFEKNPKHEDLYYQTIMAILENENNNSIPDPTKYYWASQRLTLAEQWKYQIDEKDGKQVISFTVKFKGQPEKTFKTIDFSRQKEIAPVNVQDFQDLEVASTQAKAQTGEENAQVPTELAKEPLGKDAEGKLAPKPVAVAKTTDAAKQVSAVNNETSSLFKLVKEMLGYNKESHGTRPVELSGNQSAVFAQAIMLLRDTPGVGRQIIQQVTAEAGR